MCDLYKEAVKKIKNQENNGFTLVLGKDHQIFIFDYQEELKYLPVSDELIGERVYIVYNPVFLENESYS